MQSQLKSRPKNKMPGKIQKFIDDFTPYLDDAWRRVYKTAIFFGIVFALGFLSAGWIIKNFIGFFHLSNVSVVVTSPFQLLDVAVDIGIFLAVVATFPVVLWQVYSFIRPAVSKTEFKALKGTLFYLPLSIFLFAFGFAYGFFSIYFGLQALASLNVSLGLKNIWDVGTFLSQLVLTASLLGIMFQFPLVLKILGKFRLLEKSFLKGKRRVAYATIVIITSLLPPTDGLSLIIMSLPLILMYEITILFM